MLFLSSLSPFISGLKHDSARADDDLGVRRNFLSESLSKSYGKLSSAEQDTPKQVTFASNPSRVSLQSRSHPSLDLTKPTSEPTDKASTNSSPYHLSNGLTASLAISTAPSQTGITSPKRDNPSENNPPMTISDVIRIAKEQNQAMQMNKKGQVTQDSSKAKRSLFCLKLSNPFRRACIRIVEWK